MTEVLPAHDLVSEEDTTHLWVLVLTFIQNGLMGQKHRQTGQVLLNREAQQPWLQMTSPQQQGRAHIGYFCASTH